MTDDRGRGMAREYYGTSPYDGHVAKQAVQIQRETT